MDIPPIDLLVEERCRLHGSGEGHQQSRRNTERERTLDEWQGRWQEEQSVGQWTKRLMPDVKAWYGYGWRTLGYQLTQFFTGHGVFEASRDRPGKISDAGCRYCGREVEDTPEHTVLRCPRWEQEREELKGITGNILEIEKVTKKMVENRESWNKLSLIVKKI